MGKIAKYKKIINNWLSTQYILFISLVLPALYRVWVLKALDNLINYQAFLFIGQQKGSKQQHPHILAV